MRRFAILAATLGAALALAAPAQADYLISGPHYTTPSGRECQVKVETYLYDQASYFFSLQVMEDVRNSCGYISGTGFNYPLVSKTTDNPAVDGFGPTACAWENRRSDPTPGYIINTYQKTVCQGAPSWYRSYHNHGINLMNGARWNLGPGCHNFAYANGGATARYVCINGDRTQAEVVHYNYVWVA